MTEEQVVTNPDYLRAQWMLDHQVSEVDDFVRFWKVYGKARVDFPQIEAHPDWGMLY